VTREKMVNTLKYRAWPWISDWFAWPGRLFVVILTLASGLILLAIFVSPSFRPNARSYEGLNGEPVKA
jgi:hypothetical protein